MRDKRFNNPQMLKDNREYLETRRTLIELNKYNWRQHMQERTNSSPQWDNPYTWARSH